jgi:hypothetical protein
MRIYSDSRQPEQAVGKSLDLDNKNYTYCRCCGRFSPALFTRGNKTGNDRKPQLIERNISILLQPQNEAGTAWKTAISKIEKAWKDVYPEDEFEYRFFDEEIANILYG